MISHLTFFFGFNKFMQRFRILWSEKIHCFLIHNFAITLTLVHRHANTHTHTNTQTNTHTNTHTLQVYVCLGSPLYTSMRFKTYMMQFPYIIITHSTYIVLIVKQKPVHYKETLNGRNTHTPS